MGGEKVKCEAAATATGGAAAAGGAGEVAGQKKQLKACCACPETKKVRDICIVEQGEENCRNLIEAHLVCMRKLGFNI